MGKLNLSSIPPDASSSYPAPFAQQVAGRSYQRLSRAGGITQFGANIVTVAPGGRSSMRHWHVREDELVVVLSGEMVLLQDAGEVIMGPGDCAAFPAGHPDGHCLLNRSENVARFLVVGAHFADETVHYPDVDLHLERRAGVSRFAHKDGTAYPTAAKP